MKNLRFKKTWLILGLFFLYILFYLCLRPGTGQQNVIPHFDKILHFTAYFSLSLYFHQVFKEKYSSKLIIALTLIGILIEFLQEISVNRTFEYLDMITNSFGAISGSIASMALGRNLLIFIESKLKGKVS